MPQEELQIRYDRLVDKVRRMRGVQNDYCKYRVGSDKVLMLRLQREVDLMILEDVKRKQSKQQEIF